MLDTKSLFVGRKEELQQLRSILRSTISDWIPKFALVSGDFGTGKTALVECFLAEIAQQKIPALIGRSKCSMETEGNGLVPFSQMLSTITEQALDQRVVMFASILEFIKAVAPAWLDVMSLGAASNIVKASAKTIEEGSKLLGRSAYSQENIFIQFTNTIGKLAKERPIITFLDDLQWADVSSLSLLFHLARNLQDCPIFFICAFRPVTAMEESENARVFQDVRANLIRHGAHEIELLNGIDVEAYIAQRYPLNNFPITLNLDIQKLTSGHALFVSELFSLWEHQGIVNYTPTPDRQVIWSLSNDVKNAYTIPKSVSEVLAVRLRLMEDELREILVSASVEGEDFTAQVTLQLQEQKEDNVYKNLEQLERRYHLIQDLGAKEVDAVTLDFYRFAHRFFREYIYDQLGPSRRRILHKQVANCLEKIHVERSEVAGQLALHYYEAREPLKAAQYALLASRFEYSHYAWSEGKRWCEFGLEASDHLPSSFETKRLQFDLLEMLGYGYFNSGNNAQAENKYQQALSLASLLQIDQERVFHIYLTLSDLYDYEGKPSQCMFVLDQARKVLKDSNTPFGELHIALQASDIYMQSRQDAASSVESYNMLLSKAKGLPKTKFLLETLTMIYNLLGIALSDLGKFKDSNSAYAKAIEFANQLGDKRLEVTRQLNRADNLIKMGEFEEGVAVATKAEELSRQIGDQANIAFAQATMGMGLLGQGKFEEAKRQFVAAINLSDQMGDFWNMASMYADLGIANLMLSDLEAAYKHAMKSLSYLDKTYPFETAYVFDKVTRIEFENGDKESAEQHFKCAITMCQEKGYRYLEAQCKYHFAVTILEQQPQKAIELLKFSLPIFEELELDYYTQAVIRNLNEARKRCI